MNKTDLIPIVCQEECAEVIQAISKVFRFGLEQTHPETGVSNRKALQTEIGQLLYMLDEVEHMWDLDLDAVMKAYEDKRASYRKWLNYFPKGEQIAS